MKDNNFFSLSTFKKSCRSLKKAIKYSREMANKSNFNIPLLIQQNFCEERTNDQTSSRVAIFFDLEHLKKSAIADFFPFHFSFFVCFPDKFHVFTTLSNSHYCGCYTP